MLTIIKIPTSVSMEYFFIISRSVYSISNLQHERRDHVVHHEHEHAREHDRRRRRDADALGAVHAGAQVREIALEAAHGRNDDREYERLQKPARSEERRVGQE